MVLERLESDHAELDGLLNDTFAAVAGGSCPEAFQRLDLFWARLAMHIRAEHLHLFPAVRSLFEQADRDPTLRTAADPPGVLDELRRDHDFFMVQLARAIKAMRLTFYFGNCAETLKVVRELLDEVRDRLAAHNRCEETMIYPFISENLFPPDKIAALDKGIDTELSRFPPRFSSEGK